MEWPTLGSRTAKEQNTTALSVNAAAMTKHLVCVYVCVRLCLLVVFL